MKPAWTPEIVVTVALARRLVEEQFPEMAPATVELLGEGWDNTAYVVNGSYVFRFPRRLVAVPLIETETRLLPAIAPLLPLPIPAPAYAGEPSEAFPWPFSGYPLIPGRTACTANLADVQRANMAPVLGQFLTALHAFPAARAAECGAGPDTLRRLDVPLRVSRARILLEQFVERGVLADGSALRAILDADWNGPLPRGDTLVHGDLYTRHLVVNDDATVAAVIDWGDLHLGDPAIDLAIAHLFLPPSAHQEFLQAYGAVEDSTWRLARLRALWHSLMVLGYSLNVSDRALAREAQKALAYLAVA